MAELLPADKPIVSALRLPERLTQISTSVYAVGDVGHTRDGIVDGRLKGVICSDAPEAAAASAGADFLVIRGELPDEQLAGLCQSVPLPIFVRSIALERAWILGATGIQEIAW
jgi:hypothetical protein